MENSSSAPLTFNGIHLNEHGDEVVSAILDEGLFGPRPAAAKSVDLDKLRAEVNEKNLQFFYDHRAVNGYYIYGDRKSPFGVVNFPERVRQAAEDDRQPRPPRLGCRPGKAGAGENRRQQYRNSAAGRDQLSKTKSLSPRLRNRSEDAEVAGGL